MKRLTPNLFRRHRRDPASYYDPTGERVHIRNRRFSTLQPVHMLILR